MYAPQLALACFISQRLKGNRHLERPAIAGKHSFGFHHDVHAKVSARSFSHDSVSLHSEWIKADHIRAALIVEGVEEDTHVVFAENLVTLGNGSPHFVGLV